jgi:hypothetical protein
VTYSGDLKSLGVGDSDTIFVVGSDALSLEDVVPVCQIWHASITHN